MLRPRSGLIGACLLVALWAASASARTWYVTVDGLGDAPTIQAAADSSSPGDTLLVGPGTYFEQVLLADSTALIGESGRDFTTIDADGAPSFAVTGRSVLIEGLTLTGAVGSGYAYDGYAVYTIDGDAVRDCRFSQNVTGALFLGNITVQNCEIDAPVRIHGRGVGSSALIEECSFTSTRVGNFPLVTLQGSVALDVTVRQCVFEGCLAYAGVAYDRGSLYPAADVTLQVVGNLFLDNDMEDACVGPVDSAVPGPGRAGWMEVEMLVAHNTFVGNTRAIGGTGGLWLDEGTTVEYNVVVGNDEGIRAEPAVVSGISCNLVWDNGVDWTGVPDQTGQNGNVSADPQFCSPGLGDYTVAETSPCVPQVGGSCPDFIGALGIGCKEVSIQPTSWARIKEMYR